MLDIKDKKYVDFDIFDILRFHTCNQILDQLG